MEILQTCVGMNGGPTVGQVQYQNDLFKKSFVEMIVVNNVTENRLNPSPDFTHDPLEGIVKRNNVWEPNDKAIFFYSNCNCK